MVRCCDYYYSLASQERSYVPADQCRSSASMDTTAGTSHDTSGNGVDTSTGTSHDTSGDRSMETSFGERHDTLANMNESEHESRKRRRNMEKWKQNVRKTKRAHGEDYTTRIGKKVPAKQLGPGCTETCRMKCHTKFTTEDLYQSG